MEIFRELIDERTAGIFVMVLSLAIAVAGAALAGIDRSRKRPALRGMLFAGSGVLVYLLWSVLKTLQNHLGFDSLAVVILGVLLFVGAGIALGAALAKASR